MADKAVSTEDLPEGSNSLANQGYLGLVRLEAILNTLLKKKVEEIKHGSAVAVHKATSPTQITIEGTELLKKPPKIRYAQAGFRQYSSSSCNECECRASCEEPCDDIICIEGPGTCYCNSQIIHYDDDYVALKIEDPEEALRRARRKRRRRRKRRLKKRMAMNVLIDPIEFSDQYKIIASEEISSRARWTIIATACVLLFMCLLLVVITLRMAPLIDDIVRQENEDFVKNLKKEMLINGQSFSC